MAMPKTRFILINRSNLKEAAHFPSGDEVGCFLWGKRLSNWIVIKDGLGITVDQVVHLRGSSLGEIAKACDSVE